MFLKNWDSPILSCLCIKFISATIFFSHFINAGVGNLYMWRHNEDTSIYFYYLSVLKLWPQWKCFSVLFSPILTTVKNKLSKWIKIYILPSLVKLNFVVSHYSGQYFLQFKLHQGSVKGISKLKLSIQT